MATKYIVDNLTEQTISGNVTINGNLSVTGVTTGNLTTYKALLTQLGSQTGNTLNGFGGFNDGLIIGETYTITDYISDDDFSNIADVISGGVLTYSYSGTSVTGLTTTYTSGGATSGEGSGVEFEIYINNDVYESISIVNIGYGYASGDTITILGIDVGGVSPDNDITITVDSVTTNNPNVTGCAFIATGEIPTNWNNGSTLVSSGNLVVTVLENNLGFDIDWVDGEIGAGVYLGFNSITGPLYNNFNRNTTFVLGGGNSISFFGLEPNLLETFIGPVSFVNEKDDIIFVAVVDTEILDTVADNLYYFPVQIQILQNVNTTPIVISGTVETSFPIYDSSISLFCNGNYIQSLYGDGTVNDMSELITYLNFQPNMSYLGVYSDAGDGFVNLEMSTNLVNQFCSSGTLTFEVFND
jgi:hypothetical protein